MILGHGGKYDFTLSPQQITSCTPSTGTYGADGCNGGFTEAAYDYVKSAPGLANGFFIPYEQSLTATDKTVACPTAKVAAITGEYKQLQGGYAQVTGTQPHHAHRALAQIRISQLSQMPWRNHRC